MAMSPIAQYGNGRLTTRSGPPVGRAFASFAALLVGLSCLAGGEVAGIASLGLGANATRLGSQFGVVAGTIFAITGALSAYRALAIRNGWAAAIAGVLIGPGAAWSWSTFVVDGPGSRLASSYVVAASGVLSILLLAKGLRLAHWLEVFGGLGLCGLTVVAAMVRLEPSATASATPALLAVLAGLTCLYGLLIDFEVAEHRSLVELVESRSRIEHEVAQVEELLHDLRGGLLAIEAAIGSFDGELAAPLQAEAARLRRLTLTGARSVTDFDLVERVENLIAARQAAGVPVSLHGDGQAMTWGEESEVLAIVDNLLSNAERHGEPGPIRVEITTEDGITRLTVTNPGQLPTGDPDDLFERGVTNHPDGQGLGLARARLLAEVNGADLRAVPAEAGLATFVLSLRSPTPVAA